MICILRFTIWVLMQNCLYIDLAILAFYTKSFPSHTVIHPVVTSIVPRWKILLPRKKKYWNIYFILFLLFFFFFTLPWNSLFGSLSGNRTHSCYFLYLFSFFLVITLKEISVLWVCKLCRKREGREEGRNLTCTNLCWCADWLERGKEREIGRKKVNNMSFVDVHT